MQVAFYTDNDAFCDADGNADPAREVARILRDIARKIEDGETDGNCRDANGNKVGTWQLGRCRMIELAEEERRGEMLAHVLRLPRNRSGHPYNTEWGTKTALGLFRTVKRIIEDGK